MAIKSTSKMSFLLSIVAIVCGLLCLFYCLTNLLPVVEIRESFVEIIQNMKEGVVG